MEFITKSGIPEKRRSACIVVGVFEPRSLSGAAESVDRATDGYLSELLRRGDMNGKLGATLMLHGVPGIEAERVMLLGLGKHREFRAAEYRRAIAAMTAQLLDTGAADATLCLDGLEVRKHDLAWSVLHAVLMTRETLYRFDRFKSAPDQMPRSLHRLSILVAGRKQHALAETALSQGIAIAAGIDLARDLGNLPPNYCNPAYLADQARELGLDYGLDIEVLERDDMERLGMLSLLSVARGSHQAPKFIIMKHNKGDPAARNIVLVGKGITFDSGGISLKPGLGMDEMKFDMCGAASVLGTMKTAALLDLPLNLIGVIPATENMPGGNASRPGDVVTSMSGKTIEILNTDAEGRLILCDALTYVQRFDPDCVVDVATLTGACVTALGHVTTGLFANHDPLARELLAAGQTMHDRAWQMPLWEDYQEQLKSNFADLANIGGPPAGSITAACFLSRFADKYHWAHLDIAGTAWKSGKEKGATGRPVALLSRFLIDRASGQRNQRDN